MLQKNVDESDEESLVTDGGQCVVLLRLIRISCQAETVPA